MKTFMYSYEQMRTELEKLAKKFPGRMITETAGLSADGRPIIEVILGNQRAPYHVLIHAGMHGREYLNSALVIRQMEAYLRETEPSASLGVSCAMEKQRQFYESVCFHIIPMANPDGCTISQEGIFGIRSKKLKKFLEECCEKERASGTMHFSAEEYFRRWKANARGVDINRNFSADWGECTGSVSPGAGGYKGVCPESEEETKAILSIEEKYSISCCISYHSSGNLIYWDFGSKGEVYCQDKELAERVGETTGYELHSTVSDKTDGAGCSDYFVKRRGIPSITIETGKSPCPLPAQEFYEICERNKNVWKSAGMFCMHKAGAHCGGKELCR